MLAEGVPPAYVQELGHASIELTVGTHGRWLRKRAEGAVDRLDGSGVVAETPEVVARATGCSDHHQDVPSTTKDGESPEENGDK